MCNGSIWPVFHSLPGKAVFRVEFWNFYFEINKYFATKTFELLKRINKKNTLVWVHDYHLLIMPLLLKNLMDEESLHSSIAFFLHIPFPAWDIFRQIPWANEILLGLLGCDLIAFHTVSYAMNFLECCHRILGTRIDKTELLV